MSAVRILVHDYAGHVAQVEVSRELARRGYQVLHLYAAGLETPRGALERRPGDPLTFDVQPVFFKGKFQKHNYVRRQLQEIEYGTPLTKAALAFKPDIVLSANTPLIPQAQLQWACHRRGIPFIFWMTDIYCLAVQGGVRKNLGWLGKAIVAFYRRLECFLVQRADGVIVITERFRDILFSWNIRRQDIEVIPVCAPFDEIPIGRKDNKWSRSHDLAETLNVVYSGTLGTKHNPRLIARLADRLSNTSDARVIVISEGIGAEFLKSEKAARGLDNLILLPFQPFEDFPSVLASADILLAILEPAAATYSIPSKVLSQLCASRPQVVAVPEDNCVAELIVRSGAGFAVSPNDELAFVEGVSRLLNDGSERRKMGKNGRNFAEREFGIERLIDSYKRVIEMAFSRLAVGTSRHASRSSVAVIK